MRTRHWLALAIVLVVVAVGAGIAVPLLGMPSRRPTPSATSPPAPRPSFPAVARVDLPPTPGAGAPLPAQPVLAAALTPLARAAALGGDSAGVVVDARTGTVLYARHGDQAMIPASTAKLATATAALATLGADHVLTTRVVLAGGRVVLVGGGDPTLASAGGAPSYPGAASLETLARHTAAALRASGIHSVTVGYDASLYAGPALGPGWKQSYVTGGDVAPVSALEVDEGRLTPKARPRTENPAALAGQRFAAALTAAGVTVTGDVSATTAAADATALASVSSPPLSELVERMLMNSDNDIAEALARQVALARGRPATFAGGAAAVEDTVRSLGVSGVHLVDGSGLSRDDRVTATALTTLLRLDAQRAGLRPVVTGLPVAGFAGTLDERFTRPPTKSAAGDIRAKTGTLFHVSSLAGLTVDADGRLLMFAFLSNGVPALDPTAAEHALDVLAATVTSCGCRAASATPSTTPSSATPSTTPSSATPSTTPSSATPSTTPSSPSPTPSRRS